MSPARWVQDGRRKDHQGLSPPSPPHHSHGWPGLAGRQQRRTRAACLLLPAKYSGSQREQSAHACFSQHQHGHLRLPNRARSRCGHIDGPRGTHGHWRSGGHLLLLLRKRSTRLRSSPRSATWHLKWIRRIRCSQASSIAPSRSCSDAAPRPAGSAAERTPPWRNRPPPLAERSRRRDCGETPGNGGCCDVGINVSTELP